MQLPYRFHPQLILRTPTYPFNPDVDAATIRASLHDPLFQEAVYLASPVLYEECRKWQRGELTDPRKEQKLLGTLTRYYMRSSSRCTPFGLFAGCGVVSWGEQSRIELTPAAAARHTRLDMHYLCALAQHLAEHPLVRPHLRYWPNSSLYLAGEELRYIEYHYAGSVRQHQISAVSASPYLLELLEAARPGLPYPALVAALSTDEADQDEATEFVEALIQAQVLVHELEPTVTGEEFFTHIQRVLARLGAAAPEVTAVATAAQILETVRQQLEALDRNLVNPASCYEQIVATLEPLGVPVDVGKLFQTDAVPGVSPTATLAESVQAQLLAALQVLHHLMPPTSHPRLDDFRRRFQARYEEQEVPLLEALDNESGLSYTDYGKSIYSPLIQDLALRKAKSTERAAAPRPIQQYLDQKLRQAERLGHYTVDVTPAELREFAPAPKPLPPSMSVMFRVLAEGKLLLESAGGSSAVNLLGRFAHAEPRIGEIVRDIARTEQLHNPAVAFAEICHLPSSRVGNILLRPDFRALEIPYLAQSARPAAEQVRVQDLRLAVRGGQLVLRSSRTGQRIMPRLSSAHNFTHEALPVYQLLCDLQTQGLQAHLAFSWPVSGTTASRFLPRLTCGPVVLAPASWQLEAADLQPLLAAPSAERSASLRQFRQRWQLPRFFTLADGDNELLVDAENELLTQVWLETIRNRPSVLLKEFLFDPAASPVRDAAGRAHTQQFVALLLHQGASYPALGLPERTATEHSAPVRSFSLGSEWLYYKLYCGQKVADRVLLEAIRPLTQELQALGLIDYWFFIRYADPDNHLRVRFHLPEPARIGQVVALVNSQLTQFTAHGAVWKVQTDTYQRELERYGATTIGLAERLFGYQSEAVVQLLAEAPAGGEENWLWGLGAAEELLNAFQYSTGEKARLLLHLKESFGQEFGLDKALKIQLDAKYRAARPAIQRMLDTTEQVPVPAPLAAIAEEVLALIACQGAEVSRDGLLSAYLHMLLNRLIPAEARLHELVLYDFLHRHYQSRQAIRQQQPA